MGFDEVLYKQPAVLVAAVVTKPDARVDELSSALGELNGVCQRAAHGPR